MGRNWASKVIPVLAALACFWGCERGENALPASAVPTEQPMSAEMKEAVRMRAALDGGDVGEALAGARRLMRSEERDIRSEALTVLTWLGKRAMPELAEMMRDADGDLAQEALSGWEQGFDELKYDFERSRHLLAAVSNLTDRAMLDAVMMKITGLEETSALPLLQEVILSCRGLPASICAKEMFEHLSGEPWSSTNRTSTLIQKSKEF